MGWATVIDLDACIGCHACTIACREEFGLPLGVERNTVKAMEFGTGALAQRAWAVNRCVQCADAPCVAVCPTGAVRARPDGIVVVEAAFCIGCKACVVACPYDAMFVHPDTGTAGKCDLCTHRLDRGMAPACVTVCPTAAIQVSEGEADRPDLATGLGAGTLRLRRPELDTRPAVYYQGGHPLALSPLAAARSQGGILASCEQPDVMLAPLAPPRGQADPERGQLVHEGSVRPAWDGRASLSSWIRSIAAGVYLVPTALVVGAALPADSALARLVAPAMALLYLGIAAAVLISSLERPGRVRLLLRRPRLGSWLVRGALLMIAFAAVLVVQLLATLLGAPLEGVAYLPGLLLAAAIPTFQALLLRQCLGRDLWRSVYLWPRLFVQAVAAGAAMLLPFVSVLEPDAAPSMEAIIALTTGLLSATVAMDLTHPPATLAGQRAWREMTRGLYRGLFWSGSALTLMGILAPVLGALCTPIVLAGLLLVEHAWMQAGQAVPQG